MSDSKLLAWHFLANDGRMQFGGQEHVEAGKTYTISTDERKLSLCNWGLHASERAIDALSYAPGSMVCRVELSGEILRDTDKLCATERHILWMADATYTLHEFSAWAAEWILDRLEAKGYEIDARSRAAITAKRRWLTGEITDKELAAARAAASHAARAAAWDAARDAARDAALAAARDAARDAALAAARDAARDAARAAARDAARDAAWDVAWAAAWDAARDAARDELNAKLTEMLLALEPAEVAS